MTLSKKEQAALAILSRRTITPAAAIMPEYGLALMNLWRHGMVTYCAGALALSNEGKKLLAKGGGNV